MNEEEIQKRLKEAIEALYTKQPNIFIFSSETGQTEWNLAHHLAIEAHRLFPNYDCDLDVTKPNLARRRPDIIFHKRGSNESNYLVIEVKRDAFPASFKDDIEKIKSIWFGHPLHYQFGAVINLKSNKAYEIRVLRNS
jgi:hypothetical protein